MSSLITFISDSHDLHEKIPLMPSLALVHTGDATSDGKMVRVIQFLDWMASYPAMYKIFVPGNHDRHSFTARIMDVASECKKRGIQLLINSGFTIPEPRITFWGMPLLVPSRTPRRYLNIPECDILLTHEPARGRLDHVKGRPMEEWEPADAHLGHRDLVDVRCKIHACGHIHEDRGQLLDRLEPGRVIHRINSALCNDERPLQLVHKPIVVDWSKYPE